MATGIVSVGLSLDDLEVLSRVLLVVAALVWYLVLAGVVRGGARERRRRRRSRRFRTRLDLAGVRGLAPRGLRLFSPVLGLRVQEVVTFA
jgi:hypothetical protein